MMMTALAVGTMTRKDRLVRGSFTDLGCHLASAVRAEAPREMPALASAEDPVRVSAVAAS
jgi:hypothetical protein